MIHPVFINQLDDILSGPVVSDFFVGTWDPKYLVLPNDRKNKVGRKKHVK